MSEICSATPYISFSQLFREKTNQIELVIPSLWKKLPKNWNTLLSCSKDLTPLSPLWPYLQSIRRPDLHWKRPPGIYNPTSSKELFSMLISLKVSFLWELWHLETATKCYVQIFYILSSSLTTQSFGKFFEAAKFEIVGICYILQ